MAKRPTEKSIATRLGVQAAGKRIKFDKAEKVHEDKEAREAAKASSAEETKKTNLQLGQAVRNDAPKAASEIRENMTAADAVAKAAATRAKNKHAKKAANVAAKKEKEKNKKAMKAAKAEERQQATEAAIVAAKKEKTAKLQSGQEVQAAEKALKLLLGQPVRDDSGAMLVPKGGQRAPAIASTKKPAATVASKNTDEHKEVKENEAHLPFPPELTSPH